MNKTKTVALNAELHWRIKRAAINARETFTDVLERAIEKELKKMEDKTNVNTEV